MVGEAKPIDATANATTVVRNIAISSVRNIAPSHIGNGDRVAELPAKFAQLRAIRILN
jgi:hypothetical protein